MDIIFRFVDHDDALGARLYSPTVLAVEKKQLREEGKQLKRLPSLGYADDVMLLANSVDAAQVMLKRLEEVGALFGLYLNMGKGKTEAMLFNVAATQDHSGVVSSKGVPIGITLKYKYLGCLLGVPWQDDFKHRVQKTWGLIHQYDSVWRANANRWSKQHLFNALVLPSLLFSSVSWPKTTAVFDKINGVHNRMLRHCLNNRVHFDDLRNHRPIEDLMGYQCYPSVTLIQHHLSAIGHWIRQRHTEHPRHFLVVDVLNYYFTKFKGESRNPILKKRKGNPQTVMETLLKLCAPDDEDDTSWTFTTLYNATLNRSNWRGHVTRLTLAESGRVAAHTAARRAKEAENGLREWNDASAQLLVNTMNHRTMRSLERIVDK